MPQKINWTDGQLITLGQGDTASNIGGLNKGQLYCLFFYNAANNQASTDVSVVWSNSQGPVKVPVPGSTQNLGLAALCFVNGDDTNTVSATVLNNQPGAQLQAFIGSVKMPVNTTGINNKQLPLDGSVQPFTAFTRYYAVPASHWYAMQLTSNVNQFISVQFTEQSAKVNIINSMVDPTSVLSYCGTSAQYVTKNIVNQQSTTVNFQGNGSQQVWINADSLQNSQTASISVQSLSSAYEAFR